MDKKGCFVVEWGNLHMMSSKGWCSTLWHFRRHLLLRWESCMQLWDSNLLVNHHLELWYWEVSGHGTNYLKLIVIKESIRSLKVDRSSGAKEWREICSSYLPVTNARFYSPPLCQEYGWDRWVPESEIMAPKRESWPHSLEWVGTWLLLVLKGKSFS